MERVISHEIRLAPLQLSDAQAFLAAVEYSRENLSRYMPWEKDITDCNSAEAYIDSRIRSGVPGSAWFSIWFNEQFSGVFAVKSIDPVSRISELGYWLADNARGQRVVDQVLQVMLPALASEQDVRVFEFHCLESNHASINIVKRLGATLSRKVKHDLTLPDCHDLLCIYALDANQQKSPLTSGLQHGKTQPAQCEDYSHSNTNQKNNFTKQQLIKTFCSIPLFIPC